MCQKQVEHFAAHETLGTRIFVCALPEAILSQGILRWQAEDAYDDVVDQLADLTHPFEVAMYEFLQSLHSDVPRRRKRTKTQGKFCYGFPFLNGAEQAGRAGCSASCSAATVDS